MSAISEVINEIAEIFASDSCDIRIEGYVSKLNTAEENACDFSELIAIKYNKCILLDKFPNGTETEFKQNLNELNSLLLSPIVDDSTVNDELYFNVAKLNFKVHDCDTAKLLLDKSIAQEIGNVDIGNIDLRYNKRCLKGYCLEYIALTSVKLHALSSCGSANGIIKIGTLNEIYQEVFEFLTGKKIAEFSNYSDVIIPLTVDLYNVGKESNDGRIITIEDALVSIGSTKGFLYEILASFKPVLMQAGKQNDCNNYIKEFAHVLAHCLSEYCKAMHLVPINQREGRTNLIYFTRLSDVLMRELGNNFAPCYATIKIEKEEYFLAIERMYNASNAIDEQLRNLEIGTGEYKKKQRELAQLNFYIWYFSFITKIQVDEKYKKDFFKYAEQQNDIVAKTYYGIFSFKEMLEKAFTNAKLDQLTDVDVNNLEICKNYFDSNKPDKAFPPEIIDESVMLSLAYDAFMLCRKFLKSGFRDEISLYKLQKLMSLGSIIPQTTTYKSNNSVQKGVWCVSVGAATFIYKGLIINLKTTLSQIGTQLGLTKVYDDVKILFEEFKGANAIVFVRDGTFDDDIQFIKNIDQHDGQTGNSIDHHNIYVDLSEIKDEARRTLFKQKINNNYCNVKYFYVREISVQQCLMFSMLEECWNRLNNPLEAFVISPVASSESYSYQDCSVLVPLSYDKFLGFKSSFDFNNWGEEFKSNLAACYSGERLQHRHPKQLHKENLNSLSIKDKMKYIVYLETGVTESIIYSFNFHDVCCVSDGIIVSNNKTGKNEILSAIDSIYRKYRQESLHNHRECRDYPCLSICRAIDVNSDSTYKTFRDYIYSYVGVMLDEFVYVLLRNEKTD